MCCQGRAGNSLPANPDFSLQSLPITSFPDNGPAPKPNREEKHISVQTLCFQPRTPESPPSAVSQLPGPRQKAGGAEPRTRAGASSRWQQRAAAPPALPTREPASWMASSSITLCSPWNSRPLTRTRIHELVAGAGAGASGSQSWPRGGSLGGSRVLEAGRGRVAPALPPRGPHPLWAPKPLGWNSPGCVRADAASSVSAWHSGPRSRAPRAPVSPPLPPPPPPSRAHLRLLVYSPSRPMAPAQA